MASLSALLILVPSRPWRVERIQTRILHVHPAANIHHRGTLLRVCYSGVQRVGPPPTTSWRTRVLVTRSEATVERWHGAARTTRGPRRTGPAEDRAQLAEGRGRRTGGGSGPMMSIRSIGGVLTHRMTAETLCWRADIACVPYICICTVTTPRNGIDSFRSIIIQRCR